MSFTVSLKDLVHVDPNGKFLVIEQLNKLLNHDVPLPICMQINKIINHIEPGLKAYQKVRERLIKDNGEEVLDADGKSLGIKTTPDKEDFVKEELDKAADIFIDVAGEQLDLEHFKNVITKPIENRFLTWLFKD